LHGCVVDKRIQHSAEITRLLKDILNRIGLRDVGFDEAATLWEVFPKIGAVDAEYIPTSISKVMHTSPPDTSASACDENGFCHY
jgi:hypothetical protein